MGIVFHILTALSTVAISINQLLLFIIICSFFNVKAQVTSDSDDRTVLKPLHPTLALAIGLISIMLSIIFLILAYAKFCQRNSINFLGLNTHNQDFHGPIRSRSRFSGIDEELIDSLPFFRFSALKGSREGLECAVCISRFEDSEILRLLPKCKHAFHKHCIDEWLKSHSSCPLCRYKLEVKDLKSFAYSKSLRYLENPSYLADDPNIEIFVQREQDRQAPSRFIPGSSFRTCNEKGRKEEQLIREGKESDGTRQLLHKFKHKIIISDVFIKNRWSDVASSDFLSLNTEMIRVMSSDRFSPSSSSSSRFYHGLSRNESLGKIKEDIERKRVFDSKFSRVDRSTSIPSSCSNSFKLISPVEKRSMSEITIFSRFRQPSMKNKSKESAPQGNGGKDERIRMLWLSIARRTIQWFAGRKRNLQELEYKRQASNV